MLNVKLLFLSYQLEDFKAVIEKLEGTEDEIFVAPIKEWDKFREVVNVTIKREDIHSLGASIARMSEIILKHYGEDKIVFKTGCPPPREPSQRENH